MGDLLILLINFIRSLSENQGQKPPPRPPTFSPPPLPAAPRPGVPNRIAGPGNAQRSSNPSSVLNAPAMRQLQGRKPVRRAAVAAPPVQAKAAPAAPRAPAMDVAPSTIVNRARSGDAATVSAASIRRWATPSRLQQQFILTEIFQPPLALRKQD
jgi:hypothetical protein